MKQRLAFCDDLNAPLLGVIMDLGWWQDYGTEIVEWMQARDYGVVGAGYIILFDDHESKTEFLLRWS